MKYKQAMDPITKKVSVRIIRKIDENGIVFSIPNDAKNKDWQEYQAWLAKGNKPEAAE